MIDVSIEDVQELLEEAEQNYATDVQQAKNLAKQSLSICRDLNEPLYLARSLDLVARAYETTGPLSKAKELMEESYSLRQAEGNQRKIGISLQNLGNLARLAGEFERAEELLYQSLTIFDELNDVQQQKISIQRLHGALVYGGKFIEGARLFEDPAFTYRDLDLSNKYDKPTIVSAFCLMHLGRYNEAEERFKQTLTLYPKTAIGYAIKNLGRIALLRDDLDQAKTYLLEALTLFRKSEGINGLGQTLGCLGILALRHGDRPQAQEHIHENLQMAAETLMILPSMTALSSLALLQVEKGNIETAVELYAAASQTGHVANSRWYHDVIGQHKS